MQRKDASSAIFWLGVSVFVGLKAVDLGLGGFSSPGPGFVLFCSSSLLGILSMVLLIRSVRGEKGNGQLSDAFRMVKWKIALVVIVATFLYTFFLNRVGFLLATFGLVALLFALGRVRWWASIAGAMATVVLAYVLFHKGLQVQFPKGILGW